MHCKSELGRLRLPQLNLWPWAAGWLSPCVQGTLSQPVPCHYISKKGTV